MRRILFFAIIALLVGTNAGYAQNQLSKQNLHKAFEQLDYKNLSEAVHYLGLYLEEAPDDADAHLLKSLLHGHLKQYEQALAEANNGLNCYDGSGNYDLWQFYAGRARAYRRLGEYEKALDDYDTAYNYVLDISSSEANVLLSERTKVHEEMISAALEQ